MNKRLEKSNIRIVLSCIATGLGQIFEGRVIIGLMYLAIYIGYIIYLVRYGISAVAGFITLGTVESDAWAGIEGDDSVIMMLQGIIFFFLTLFFIFLHLANIRDIKENEEKLARGKRLPNFKQELKTFEDKKFYKVALFFPILGVVIFSIMPIVFMILIAFTNYGGDHIPPRLVDWTGFDSFKKIFSVGNLKESLGKIILWNFIWAILATAINYFGGLFLALLLNKECVKGKAFWRLFPVLAYAVPGFITLIGFKFLFSYGGPINYYIVKAGHNAVGFLDIDAGIKAKIVGVFVNAWCSIPSGMLLATGILSNLNTELHDAAAIDGAGAWKKFTKITLPFMIFSTTPVLITSFVGNFNNFGVFYFLRGGLYNDGYFLASDTDLLINWLYNLSIDNNYYSIGAAVSLIIFLITSAISLLVYVNSDAYKKEDTFR